MAAFKVLELQFQMFIKSRIYLDGEYVVMTRNYFLQHTQLEIPEFRDTLIQHIESVKKSIDKRALHKREYDSRVNERQMQTTKKRLIGVQYVDTSLVDTESSETETKEQDTSSRSGNDAHDDDADIRHIYDEEPMAEPRFASQVDVNNDLSKPVTTHYLPKERESAIVKPHHVIASSESRNSLKNMSRFSSNDMVHNHYLEEAKKKTQESGRNSRPSVMPFAGSQSTVNGSKPKPRINNQKLELPASKRVANKPIEQTSFAKKPERQIPKGHRFSIKKTSVVHKKTMTPRSCLRWKPTGKIFKTVGLKWVPTGKIFASSTTKVNSKPTKGSNEDITNQYECKQTLDVSAGTLNLSVGMTSNHNSSKLRIHDHGNEQSSSKLVLTVVPSADKTATSQVNKRVGITNSSMTKEYLNAGNPSVSKSFALSGNLQQHDTQPTANIHPTLELIIPPTNVNAEENMNKPTTLTDDANSDIQDIPLRYQFYQGILLASFQDDAKYEHVGQDTRSRDGKDDKDKQGKDLKISNVKTKSKDNDKGSRSKITKHEGTSLQR
ncbi:hypothetical protein Tco_1354098 [Tanacetum coccineum]